MKTVKESQSLSILEAASLVHTGPSIVARVFEEEGNFTIEDAGHFYWGDAAGQRVAGEYETPFAAIQDAVDKQADVSVFESHRELASYILEKELS